MTEPLDQLNPGCLDRAGTAVFLDFDGTLVDIADHPDQVRLSAPARAALAGLYDTMGGAVAIVTGRDIADVDRFLKPLRLPVAGSHGLRRRRADGSVSEVEVDSGLIAGLGDRVADYAAGQEGLLVERKAASVALHYRSRPDLEASCHAFMGEAVAGLPGIHLMRGKMVVEAKADLADKGSAVEAFLAEPPFAGRVPFIAGDDVTDEDAFGAVNARGGISVKVGPGETRARYRAPAIADFLAWLRRAADELTGAAAVEQS